MPRLTELLGEEYEEEDGCEKVAGSEGCVCHSNLCNGAKATAATEDGTTMNRLK